MKRIIISFLTLIFAVACQENMETQQAEFIEVGFNFTEAEIDFEQINTIETKAGTASPRYFIQVYNEKSQPYAYAVIDNIADASLLLEDAKSYKFVVAYFPNGHTISMSDNKMNKLTDGFIYSSEDSIDPYNTYYHGGSHIVPYFPSIKYSNEMEYIASKDDTTINMTLEADIFAITVNVVNLSEGFISFKYADGFNDIPEFNIYPDNPTYYSIYAYGYKSDINEENPYVSITYTNASGIENRIYYGEIPVKLLENTVVNIELKESSNESKASFDIELGDTSITNGEIITINQE